MTGISESSVSVYLLIYGAAGILGTVVAGRTLGRSLRGTFAAGAALIAFATLLLPVLVLGVVRAPGSADG